MKPRLCSDLINHHMDNVYSSFIVKGTLNENPSKTTNTILVILSPNMRHPWLPPIPSYHALLILSLGSISNNSLPLCPYSELTISHLNSCNSLLSGYGVPNNSLTLQIYLPWWVNYLPFEIVQSNNFPLKPPQNNSIKALAPCLTHGSQGICLFLSGLCPWVPQFYMLLSFFLIFWQLPHNLSLLLDL